MAKQNKLLAQREWVDQEMVKVEAALPKQAPAKPLKPRKLLVFTYCTGYPHDSMPLAAKTFQRMGQKTGAFEATISDDPEIFAPENLNEFDAVMMNNCTGGPLPRAAAEGEPAEVRPRRQGDCRHPRHGRRHLRLEGVRRDDRRLFLRPSLRADYRQARRSAESDQRGVPRAGFRLRRRDLHLPRALFPRQKLHILLSIDWDKSAKVRESARRSDGHGWKARKDNDYAVSWIHPYGEGRVFYSCLGHWHETFWNPAMLRHFLAGIQYVLGDLPADAAPSAAGGKR